MFNTLENLLISIIQKKIKDVLKENITNRKINFKKDTLPFISVYYTDFIFEDLGIGRESGENKKELIEQFSGNGKKSSFTLSVKPLKPIISIENSIGEKKIENKDFNVDYQKGLISFHIPPDQGEKNIFVRYYSAKDAYLTRGIKVKINFHVDVWTEDKFKVGSLTDEVIKTFLIEREELIRNGYDLKPLKGSIIENNEITGTIFGNTLLYSIETEIFVETIIPLMEKIEIQRKRNLINTS